MHHTPLRRAGLTVALALGLGLLYTPSQALEWPAQPLTAMVSAKPMTMLIAGRDHKFFYEAYNDASDLDGDGQLDLYFKPGITYYGLFDSGLCYSYNSAASMFQPASQADSLGRCTVGGSSGEWSGNWLNYVSTSRIDALRKVLYGGYRDVDTNSQTVLRRAYIPQDAHSWGKEFHSSHNYRISDYTDLDEPPNASTRHFFGSLTANRSQSCATLDNCSNLQPLLRIRSNVGNNKRIWEWASKERPVLQNDLSSGAFPSGTGNQRDLVIRVEVCTAAFHNECRLYPNNQYKPIGILHEYGENGAMLFGLITGSYDQHFSGGRLRKVVSSFSDEVNATTGQFASTASIVNTFNNLRIRGFNQSSSSSEYWKSGPYIDSSKDPTEGQLVDWGNPIAEMMYEAVRYFSGKKAPTTAFNTGTTMDTAVGLSRVTWDDPYDRTNSKAKAPFCARPNLLTISDISPSYDSDQLPGSSFPLRGTTNSYFSGDITGLNVTALGGTITAVESNITGRQFFIAQSGSVDDRSPTPKEVSSLGNIRGLSPEEPTKDGSFYAASIAYYAKTRNLRPEFGAGREVYADTYAVALSSPLPRIVAKLPNGKEISLVPFAKTVGGNGVSNAKGAYQPTNQIVDFYVESIVNSSANDFDATVNGGRYSARFQINFEDVEQGGDHDMDAIAEYRVEANANNTLSVTVTPRYQAGSAQQVMGYVISGTDRDGPYLVAQDESSSRYYFLNAPDPSKKSGMCDVASNRPANCDRLPQIGETPNTFVFNPGTTGGAAFLNNPLWYAAKYGGFVDRDKSKTPNLSVEWDADNDGVPDTYFLVQNPLTLKDTLRKTFNSIIDKSGSAGNISSNSTDLREDTRAFQAKFNAQNWAGELEAKGITSKGVNETASWRASDHLLNDVGRRIFYTSPNALVGSAEFTGDILTANGDLALFKNDANLVNYLRGNRSRELQNGGSLRDRGATVLGDIAHSSPVYAKDTDTLYVGANDGMLHAFNAQNGQEVFAYIPSSVMPKPASCSGSACAGIRALSELGYNESHRYFVDGEIAVTSRSQTTGRNLLVAALGRGGRGLFALNVTNPNTFDGSNVLWETSLSDPEMDDMGHVLGRPVVARMKVDGSDVWVVIVGNGYNSANARAALYIINLETGALIRRIATSAGGDNGLAAPGVFDSDNDGYIDHVYAGDMMGNVWKFDLSSSSPSLWGVAYAGQPLYVAKDAAGNAQPITAQLRLVRNFVNADANFGKLFVHFGTGSYFRTGDNVTPPAGAASQSWYGLIDDGAPITTGRNELVPRTMSLSVTFAGRNVRTFSSASANDMVGKRGFYIDLPQPERIITASNTLRAVEPALVASIIRPQFDECVPGGTGVVAAINPFTGAALTRPFFDVNDNGSFLDDTVNGAYIGAVDLGIGMPGEAILVGNQLVVGGSTGTMGSIRVNLGLTPVRGRLTWREVVRD